MKTDYCEKWHSIVWLLLPHVLPAGTGMHISNLPLPLPLFQFLSLALQKELQPYSARLWPGSVLREPVVPLLPGHGSASASAAAAESLILRRLLGGDASLTVDVLSCSSASTMVRSDISSLAKSSL
jgi:hypothetical protein